MYKLSILISYYNTYKLTIKLLQVLNLQKSKNVEIILIDDGCNETRFDIFKKENDFYNLKIIHMKNNEGMSNALNIGLNNAIGEYIAFIDSDDMITIDYIETLLETLENHNEDIIYFNWADFNNNCIITHPNNPALWKAIYKKDIFPSFEKDRRYKNDVPIQEALATKTLTSYYIEKVLYLYNSNRKGSLTWERIQKEGQ